MVVFWGVIPNVSQAQINSVNLPNFDEQRWHFGFMLGMHTSAYQSQYVDAFVTPSYDTLHSVVPPSNPGFKIGFVVDYHLMETLDIRFSPTVAFNQLELEYRYSDGTSVSDIQDPTYVEFPILLKYKSVRRRNRRMYFLGGVNPAIKATSSKDKDNSIERLQTKGYNLSLDIGVGMDLYQPLFKFSPELRYSFGLVNVLDGDSATNDFNAPMKRLTIHTLAFYITFEGGPSTFRRKGGKQKRH
ncbi:hypothetical protein BFP72_14625 [Reichenbachiella sp. 5M10]|nr:hypothetical protein BFP72_14625 [Reichenbachiella sp. 5M10]